MLYDTRLLIVLLAAATMWPAVPVRAGLVYQRQSRHVEAGTGNYTTPEEFDNGPLRTATTSGSERFAADVRSEYTDAVTGDYAVARVGQTSTLSTDGVRVAGTMHAMNGSAHYRSRVAVTFEVTEPTPYTLVSRLDFSLFRLTVVDPDDGDLYAVVLSRGGKPLVEERLSDSELVLGKPESPVANLTGVLEPGEYDLLLDVRTTIYAGIETGSYDLSFLVGETGGPPPAVPLPPMVWAGAIVLASMAGVQRWQRRRRARAA